MPVYELQYGGSLTVPGGMPAPIPGDKILEAVGPCLDVVVSISQERHGLITRQGGVVPEPIFGRAIIDTGTTRTAVDETVLGHLDLSAPCSWAELRTATGTETRGCFPIQVLFPGTPLNPMACDEAVSVALGSSGQDHDLILLLGRDFLSGLCFTYNGPKGRVEFAF